MDVTLDGVFSRVETAFTTLVDSIAAYNPSLQAAGDLIAADDELARGIDKLAQHRENSARIHVLRAEREALEEQFRSSVAALAELRRDLFATPVTKFPDDLRPVPFDELLQYAKNIAQSTVPPTYREALPEKQSEDRSKPTEDGASSAVPSNAVGTPAQQPAQEAPQHTAEVQAREGEEQAITEEEAEWLKKLKASGFAWYPWPDEDKIRRGNLMQIQHVLDRGRDPTSEDLTKLGEDEKDRIAAEAAQAQVNQEAQAAQAQAQAKAQVQAQAQVAAQTAGVEERQPHALPPKPAEKPQQFAGFDDLDSDDNSE
ncbi:hypothetical protein DPSP01_002517 [Paraphaeosphaeria sporulosa]|uniref:Mediator of RNA polymerase II transcription subunit 4 n=1 Tax=Paraphaeosphaeria sporulosa TaxID=1460663 RepID=A0A177CV22_9PLEO|nr:uncharacterized protein CC84DRAFT_1158950 [Paraphaeosphaeria sporulosa]OAG11405.1 hypothetical protein CC84DRAFT_1158950 [Paraphaeosphaeria sporulosa]